MNAPRFFPSGAAAIARLPALCKEAAWRHPEWWSLMASGAAWALLVARAGPTAMGAGAHAHLHGRLALSPDGQPAAWRMESLHWLLMVVAMMLPMVVNPIRTTAARSLWARRHRAIGGFLIGYMTPWALLGLAAHGLIAVSGGGDWLHVPAAAAIGFAVAALWQFTAVKRRAALWCHRTAPLAPAGWAADRDCLGYGWMIGCRCLASCWALMVACLLAGHGIAAMACGAIVGASERQLPRAGQRLGSAVIAGLALAYAIAAQR
jgi:predicted metal-binding membrane protein